MASCHLSRLRRNFRLYVAIFKSKWPPMHTSKIWFPESRVPDYRDENLVPGMPGTRLPRYKTIDILFRRTQFHKNPVHTLTIPLKPSKSMKMEYFQCKVTFKKNARSHFPAKRCKGLQYGFARRFLHEANCKRVFTRLQAYAHTLAIF